MRLLALLLIAAAAFALPASAANVSPKVLVLRQSDVPERYDFDKENSSFLPIDLGPPDAEYDRLVARSGYVNGYAAKYQNSDPPRWRYVTSLAFVFRRAEGARIYLAWLDKSIRKNNTARRNAVDLGDGGWSYVSRSRSTGTQVGWRFGRVVALTRCEEMTSHRTLAFAMARKQQRRIANALG